MISNFKTDENNPVFIIMMKDKYRQLCRVAGLLVVVGSLSVCRGESDQNFNKKTCEPGLEPNGRVCLDTKQRLVLVGCKGIEMTVHNVGPGRINPHGEVDADGVDITATRLGLETDPSNHYEGGMRSMPKCGVRWQNFLDGRIEVRFPSKSGDEGDWQVKVIEDIG